MFISPHTETKKHKKINFLIEPKLNNSSNQLQFEPKEQLNKEWLLGKNGFLEDLGNALETELNKTEQMKDNLIKLRDGEINRSQIYDFNKEYFVSNVYMSCIKINEDGIEDLFNSKINENEDTLEELLKDEGTIKIDKSFHFDSCQYDLISNDFFQMRRELGSGFSKLSNFYVQNEERKLNESEMSLTQIDFDKEILGVYSSQPSMVSNASKHKTDKLIILNIKFISKDNLINNSHETEFERKIFLYEINDTCNSKKPLILGGKILERVGFGVKKQGIKELVDRISAYKIGKIKEIGYSQNILWSMFKPIFTNKFHLSFFIDLPNSLNQNEKLNFFAFCNRLKQINQNVRLITPLEIQQSCFNMFDSVCENNKLTSQTISLKQGDPDCESLWIDKKEETFPNIFEESKENKKIQNLKKSVINFEIKEVPNLSFFKKKRSLSSVNKQRDFSVFLKRKGKDIETSLNNSQRKIFLSKKKDKEDLVSLNVLKNKIEDLIDQKSELESQIDLLSTHNESLKHENEQLNQKLILLSLSSHQNVNEFEIMNNMSFLKPKKIYDLNRRKQFKKKFRSKIEKIINDYSSKTSTHCQSHSELISNLKMKSRKKKEIDYISNMNKKYDQIWNSFIEPDFLSQDQFFEKDFDRMFNMNPVYYQDSLNEFIKDKEVISITNYSYCKISNESSFNVLENETIEIQNKMESFINQLKIQVKSFSKLKKLNLKIIPKNNSIIQNMELSNKDTQKSFILEEKGIDLSQIEKLYSKLFDNFIQFDCSKIKLKLLKDEMWMKLIQRIIQEIIEHVFVVYDKFPNNKLDYIIKLIPEISHKNLLLRNLLIEEYIKIKNNLKIVKILKVIN